MWTLLWLGCASSPSSTPPEAKREAVEKPDVGRWNLARTAPASEEIAALEAIGYVGGVEGGRGLVGVTLNTPSAAPGLNLYTSGDAPEATLMDAEGRVVHTWQKTFEQAFPGRVLADDARGADFWRRVALLPDGGLLAIYEGQGLVRLDRDSNLLWTFDQQPHHDLQVLPDGRIWVLTRKAHVNPVVHAKRPILEDYATLLSADGKVLQSLSILDAIRTGPASALMQRVPKKFGDIFHTNSLEVLDGRVADPAFAAGNLLLSSRALSAVFVIDPATSQVVWHHTGAYDKLHDPKILPNGHLLLFDNLGPGGGRSAVREYELPSMQPVWTFGGSDAEPFFSRFCGAAERLPNGNTLIVESGFGRAFEIDPGGQKVWEFYNPRRTGDNQEFVAIVPDLVRIPVDQLTWLEPGPPPSE